MAYFDIVTDVCNENDLECYVEESGDNPGTQILSCSTWEEVKILNMLLRDKFEELGIDTSEADEQFNRPSGSDDCYVDFATDGNWDYSENLFTCDNCYLTFENGNFYNNYFLPENGYGIYCEHCVQNDDSVKEIYIEDLINNPDRANSLLDESDLEAAGFEEFGGTYHNGWYGRNDNPHQILDDLLKRCPDAEVVFSISKTYNPWETTFTTYVRNFDEYDEEEDEDI